MKNRPSWRKLLTAVLAVALLVGCGADKNVETEDTQIQQETQWVSKYNLPEEMRRLEEEIDKEGVQDYGEILKLAAHDFGELKVAYEFEDYIRIEQYADGYTKVYVYPELPKQLPFDNEWGYYVDFFDVNEEYIGNVSCDVNECVYSQINSSIRMIKQTNDDVAVFYFAQDCFGHQEPAVMKIVDTSGEEDVIVMTLTRETTSMPTEETTQPTEAVAAEPAANTTLLDLAGCTLQEISDVLGKYTLSDNYAWFRDGYVSYVFAYGTDMGSNYVSGALNQLIDHCPETLTLEEVQQYFPGGYTFYDDMDGRDCYGWDYRGCTLVLCMNPEGAFTNMSGFYYNSDALVQQQLQASQGVNEDLFRLPGKTKGEIDSILGESGYFEGQFGCQVYNYKDSYVWVYMDDYENGTCLGFYTPLKNIVNMASAYVQGTDLKSYFGDTYRDPWNGNTAFQTMYKGGQLRIFQNMGDQPDEFGAESAVNFRLADKEIFPNDGEQVWTNSSALFYGGVTVYSQTASEMVCEMEYYQLTPPNRVAQTGRITLTSNDGITYTASGVTDSWESQMNVTVTMLEEAAKVTFEYTKMGEMANFCFGDYIVYQ